MDITFLEATTGIRLSKHYADNKFTAYPNVKNVTSHLEHVTDIDSLHAAIMDHASRGHCMLKNTLKRPLVNESRRSMCDKFAPTQILVLDFDKFPVVSERLDLETAVDFALNSLSKFGLHITDYVAQASSSFKLRGNRFSFHVFFILSDKIDPRIMKTWLQYINLTIEEYKKSITLSENGHSLSYPLDPSVADNSKLIYIAPPTFADVQNDPFAGQHQDRIIKVTGKQYSTFDLEDYAMDAQLPTVTKLINEIKDEKRADKKLPKSKTRVKNRRFGDESFEVMENPEQMRITIADDSSLPYVRCNVNSGDSDAYWFDVFKPMFMHNFKDEPIFMIEDVDPEFANMVLSKYQPWIAEQVKKKAIDVPLKPMSFRDVHTDTYFTAQYNMSKNSLTELHNINKANLDGFYASHQCPEPAFIPDADFSFDPTSQKPAVDVSKIPYRINLWDSSKAMEQQIKWEGETLEVGTATLVKEKCPVIYRVMHHMLGNGNAEFERMMNWLAHIFQTREKAGTAWILSGVQGTGKGVFADRILRPLLGEKFVPVRTLENMEEQFNDYMRQAVVCVVDEFNMPVGKSALTKMANKLKNLITERTITIRAMRSNQVEIPSFTSFIFNSNHVDAVAIEVSDRRYNVAPRQEKTLLEVWPEFIDDIDRIEQELPLFAGALAAFNVNQRMVRVPLQNEAKTAMITAGQSVLEEFVYAFRYGKLDYFQSIMEMSITNIHDAGAIESAQRHVKNWMANVDNPMHLKQEHMRTVYQVLTNEDISAVKFGKLLTRVGYTSHKIRTGNSTGKVFEVTWVLDELTVKSWEKEYFISDIDKKMLASTRAMSDTNESDTHTSG